MHPRCVLSYRGPTRTAASAIVPRRAAVSARCAGSVPSAPAPLPGGGALGRVGKRPKRAGTPLDLLGRRPERAGTDSCLPGTAPGRAGTALSLLGKRPGRAGRALAPLGKALASFVRPSYRWDQIVLPHVREGYPRAHGRIQLGLRAPLSDLCSQSRRLFQNFQDSPGGFLENREPTGNRVRPFQSCSRIGSRGMQSAVHFISSEIYSCGSGKQRRYHPK